MAILLQQVIIESADSHRCLEERPTNGFAKHGQVALLSANSQESAQEYAGRIQEYIATHFHKIDDLAYTLAFHREALPYRAYLTIDQAANVEISPTIKAPPESPNVVMVFSGQGAQWACMGNELMQADPLFRHDIDEMDSFLQSLRHAPAWRISGQSPLRLLQYLSMNTQLC